MRILLVDVAPPPREAVTLAELRLHVRADGPDDDAMLSGYLRSARALIERRIGRAIVQRSVAGSCFAWPLTGAIVLLAPVVAVVSVAYSEAGGATVPWVDFVARTSPGEVTRLWPRFGATWPLLADDGVITITATAGMAAVPDDLRQAILLTAAHWHNAREGVTFDGGVGGAEQLPLGVAELIAPYRWRWLG